MKLIPYKTVLKMGKEAIDAMLVPSRANQAKKQGELEILKLDESLTTLEQELMELQIVHPFPWERFLSKVDEIALIERKQRKYKELIGELFPTEIELES